MPLVLFVVWSPMGPVLAVGVPLLSTHQSRSSPVTFAQLLSRVPGVPTVKPVNGSLDGKVVTHWAMTDTVVHSKDVDRVSFRSMLEQVNLGQSSCCPGVLQTVSA